MADISTLQAMYEYQKLEKSNEEEYIVRGATMFCGDGEKECVLNLPEDHVEKTSDNRPLITIKDSKNGKDVEGFGYCKALKGPCTPDLSDWSNKNVDNLMKLYDNSTQEYEYAVTRSATAKCSNGNFYVIFTSSGQVTPDYIGKKVDGIDIIEDIKKDFKKNKEDFLGHINIDHTGVYNLGLYFGRLKQENFIGGTLFLYKKKSKWMKSIMEYVGAYRLLKHNEEVKEEFTTIEVEGMADPDTGTFYPSEYPRSQYDSYWSIWSDLVLEKETDYYVEIDCPNMDYFEYKLIGNLDKGILRSLSSKVEDNIVSALWVLDPSFEKQYGLEYTNYILENSRKVPVMIFYLNDWYRKILSTMVKQCIDAHSSIREIVAEAKISETVTIGGFLLGFITKLNKGIALVENMLTIVGVLLTFLKPMDRERLYSILEEDGGTQPIKIVISMYYPNSIFYLDRPGGAASAPDPYLKIDHENFDGYNGRGITNIEGVKYLKGQYRYFAGFSTNDTIDSVIDEVMKNLPNAYFEMMKQ